MRTSIGIPGRKVGKKEVCDNDNILWDLLLDVDIESIQLRKGDVDPCFPAWKRWCRSLFSRMEEGYWEQTRVFHGIMSLVDRCRTVAVCVDRPSAASIRISVSLWLGHEDSSCGKPWCSSMSWIHSGNTIRSHHLPRERWGIQSNEWLKQHPPV